MGGIIAIGTGRAGIAVICAAARCDTRLRRQGRARGSGGRHQRRPRGAGSGRRPAGRRTAAVAAAPVNSARRPCSKSSLADSCLPSAWSCSASAPREPSGDAAGLVGRRRCPAARPPCRAGRATSRPRARTDRPSAREGSTSPTGRPAPGSSRSATAARCAATVPSGRRAAGRAARGSSARRARRGSGRRCFRCPRPAPRAGSRGPEPTVRRMEVGGGQQEHRLLDGTDETVQRARPLFRRRQGLEQAVVEHQALQAVQGDLGPAFLDVA